ncbi:phenylacetate--CoA ligase family protein [Geobacter sp.]|uniref:phenylacetate--CoA ligase family protein n=1 Tax=Geobacter sp. TaxID=46610 RepID=UPI001ACE0930|nr:AMP-binding protein [Geobacter sp.]CAG0999610.1 phenylacetate-CoA ligase [Planctomycetaceae bacterium]
MKPIIRNVLFPMHERLKHHTTIEQHRELERIQWLSPEEIREIQREKLGRFLVSVQGTVPHFRDIPTSPEQFSSIPFTTKAIIRANTDAFKATGAQRLTRFNTGGSSGEPLIFYLGKQRISADVAAKLRATRWWGVDIGDREAVIWGAPVELSKQDRIRELRDWLFQTKLLSAFDMTEETMTAYLAFLREYRPKQVFGYPSSISLLCDVAKQKKIRLDDLGVQVVFCTAERLYDHQRQTIAGAFGAPVANGYGSRDGGFIAHECPEGRLHVTDENILLEIIDEQGRPLPVGEVGEMVVTHLESHEFPFLRYRTGDVGALSDERCPCGRGLTVLKSVEGRATDFIVTPSRKVLHGLALIYKVRDTVGVEAFKIVQEDYDRITLFLVVNGAFTARGEEEIRADWDRRLDSEVAVQIDYVERIPPEKSGKFRYVVSKVTI